MSDLRRRLVAVALEAERAFANAPSVTTAVSEYDAPMLIGLSEAQYSRSMQGLTAAQKGYDFKFGESRYQVKGNRPSGKPGSRITKVLSALNYDWDQFIWILYDTNYEIQEAWLWDVNAYRNEFHGIKRLSPAPMRRGKRLALELEPEA